MSQSATVARALRLIKKSTWIPFCQCLMLLQVPLFQLWGAAREALRLGGNGRQKARVLPGAKWRLALRCAPRLRLGYSAGSVWRRLWLKSDFPISSAEYSERLPSTNLMVPASTWWGTHRELDSAEEQRIWEFQAILQFHIDFANILHCCILQYNTHV